MARLPVVLTDLDFTQAAETQVTFDQDVTKRLERLDIAADRREAKAHFEWLAGRLRRAGAPTGRVTFHMCSHAIEGQDEPLTPCTAPEAELEVRTA